MVEEHWGNLFSIKEPLTVGGYGSVNLCETLDG